MLMLALTGAAAYVPLGRAPASRAATRSAPVNMLTEGQIGLIRSTWSSVGALGSEKVGVLLFEKIFEEAPGAAALFPFGREPDFKLENLGDNPRVVKHGAKVVDKVSAAVDLLDDLPTLGPVLVGLGARHFTYSVEAVHYPVVGGAFLKTLETGLGEAYSKEVAEAYTAMWGVVETTMLSGADAPKK
jgi:hemoglobin-like flavoprotein